MVVEIKPMEIKKAPPSEATAPKEKALPKWRVRDFIEEMKAEISRINWTSREELLTYTKIVVAATFVFGLGIYVVDLLIQGFLSGLSSLIRLISG